MRSGTGFAALLLGAALSAPVARAETRLPDLYAELSAKLAALPADPFAPEAGERQRRALLARYAGRELRIPGPPPGMNRRGNAQGLWPLEFAEGRLGLAFDANGRYAPRMEDSPWNWWSRDQDGDGTGRETPDGRTCRRYSERSGYGLVLTAPGTIRAYVDDAYRQAGGTVRESYNGGQYRLDFALPVERARRLSGQLATYVRLAELSAIERIDSADQGLRVSSTLHCYGGVQHLLHGRIDRLRIHRLGSGEDLIRLRFGD